jgi:hypothetical protein
MSERLIEAAGTIEVTVVPTHVEIPDMSNGPFDPAQCVYFPIVCEERFDDMPTDEARAAEHKGTALSVHDDFTVASALLNWIGCLRELSPSCLRRASSLDEGTSSIAVLNPSHSEHTYTGQA